MRLNLQASMNITDKQKGILSMFFFGGLSKVGLIRVEHITMTSDNMHMWAD